MLKTAFLIILSIMVLYGLIKLPRILSEYKNGKESLLFTMGEIVGIILTLVLALLILMEQKGPIKFVFETICFIVSIYLIIYNIYSLQKGIRSRKSNGFSINTIMIRFIVIIVFTYFAIDYFKFIGILG